MGETGDGDLREFLLSQSRPETGHIIFENIDPHKDTVVINPGVNVKSDPILLVVSGCLTDGRLYFSGPNNSDDGTFKWAQYLEHISRLQKVRKGIHLPEWLGDKSGVLNFGKLPEDSLGTIVDRAHAITDLADPNSAASLDPENVEAAFQTYWRMLAPKGKLIFQTDNEIFGFGDSKECLPDRNTRKLLEKSGFRSVTHLDRINDVCEIPVIRNGRNLITGFSLNLRDIYIAIK